MPRSTSSKTVKKPLKVINLFGPPGVGKSAARSGVFWLMKAHHMSCEEVSEYAKYLVLSGRKWQLKKEQLYLFAKQHHKQLIVERTGYEYAVTDSPLQLCHFYAPNDYYSAFPNLVGQAFNGFDNINFFLTRKIADESQAFEDRGRVHSRKAALAVESKMRRFLADNNITYTDIEVDMFTPWRVLEAICPGQVAWPQFAPQA